MSVNKTYVQETAVIYGGNKDIGVYAQICVLNNMIAKGITPISLGASIFYGTDKSKVYPMKNRILKAELPCRTKETQIRVQRLPECRRSLVEAYGVGVFEKESSVKQEAIKTGLEIVQVGCMGKEGTMRIVHEKKGELLKRFTPAFLNQIKDWDKELFVQKEISAGHEAGVIAIHHVGEQGITQALWNLAEEYTMGMTVDIKKILVRQETIEVCEQYRMNPYRISSIGCVLMIAQTGSKLAEYLYEKGFEASVIGRFTESNDKVFQNGEEQSYIESQSADEMLKIWE